LIKNNRFLIVHFHLPWRRVFRIFFLRDLGLRLWLIGNIIFDNGLNDWIFQFEEASFFSCVFQRLILELFFVFEHVLLIQFFHLSGIVLWVHIDNTLIRLNLSRHPEGVFTCLQHTVGNLPHIGVHLGRSAPIVVEFTVLAGDNAVSFDHG
jgi:hypothetical protein